MREVQRLEQRRVSAGRTALLVLGGLALVIVVIATVVDFDPLGSEGSYRPR